MQRRKFVIGMGALASGAAAVVGTGAFDSVTANRDVQVSTTGDASAYLGLTGDGDYVSDDSDGSQLTIDLGGASTDNGGSGFNKNAVTEVSGVVTITNQGTQNVNVSIDDTDVQDAVSFSISAGDTGNDANDLAPGEEVYLDVTVDDLNHDVGESTTDTLVIEASSV